MCVVTAETEVNYVDLISSTDAGCVRAVAGVCVMYVAMATCNPRSVYLIHIDSPGLLCIRSLNVLSKCTVHAVC